MFFIFESECAENQKQIRKEDRGIGTRTTNISFKGIVVRLDSFMYEYLIGNVVGDYSNDIELELGRNKIYPAIRKQ